MTANLIDVTDLHVHYKTRGDDVMAVRGLNLTVGAGQSTGIVGESGSGKSTVAKAIVGLVPPTKGSIRIDGDLVAGEKATGYVRANRWKVQMIRVISSPSSSTTRSGAGSTPCASSSTSSTTRTKTQLWSTAPTG